MRPQECFHRILWDCDHPAFVKLFESLDPADFMRRVKEAGFESAGIFAKDSLGQSLYPTSVGHVHPGLSRDFLGEMTSAAKTAGLTVVAYVNGTQDPYQAKIHPEWRERSPAEKEFLGAETTQSTPFVCLHGGFSEAILIPQLVEVVERYPVDGIFLDICGEPHTRRVCACTKCAEEYRRAFGRELPGAAAERAEWLRYSEWRRKRHRAWRRQVVQALRAARQDAALTINYAFSARQPDPPEALDYLSLDVEEHTNPLAGAPAYLRYANSLGLPLEVFVSQMQHWWWDWDLRPLAAMELQAAEILANGGAVCVGSNLHPSGRLDGRVMDQLKEFNRFLDEREPFCRDAKPVANVAILHASSALMARSAAGYSHGSLRDALWAFRGAARIFMEGHVPFQFINEPALRERAGDYDLLVLPEQAALSDVAVAAIAEYVRNGGRLLALGETATQDEQGRDRPRPALDEVFSARTAGRLPWECGYGRFREDSGARIGGVLLLEGTWLSVEPEGGRVLADLLEPYHGAGPDENYAAFGVGLPPPSDKIVGAAVILNQFGKGRAVYVPGPVCTQHGVKTQLEWRDAALWLAGLLLPQKLLETDAPATVEVALTRQGRRIICHLINYGNEKGYSTRQLPEQIAPLFNLGIRLRAGPIQRATAYPGGHPLEFVMQGDLVSVCLPRLDLHAWIVLEGMVSK